MQKIISDSSNPTANFQTNENEKKIDLVEIFGTLIDNKWLIALITAVVLAFGTAVAFLDSPVYKTDAMLQVEPLSKGFSALDQAVSSPSLEMPVMAEVELINSRMVLGEVIKNLHLDIVAKPRYFPLIGGAIARRYDKLNKGHKVSDAWFGLEQYGWGGEAIQVDTFTVPPDWLDKKFTLIAGEQPGHFQLTFKDEPVLEGEVGKVVSKKVGGDDENISIFVSLLKSRPGTEFHIMQQSEGNTLALLKNNLRVAEKGKLTRILELTLEQDDPQSAVQVLNEIVNIYVRKNVEQKSAEAQKKLEFLEQQMPLLKKALDESTTALDDYRTRKGSVDLNIETQNILANVVRLKTEITRFQQKRDELSQKFTVSHPTVVALDKQIARLQEQMNVHDKKIGTLPETQQAILKLSRDVKVNTELYTALLNSSQTLRVAKAGTIGDVRIIDYALLPMQPIKPNKPAIIAFSLILGLLSGMAITFIRKALHRVVKDPASIERKLNIPVYATIPHSTEQEKLAKQLKRQPPQIGMAPLILATHNKNDLAVESLRSLRTTLHFAFLEAQNNIIMITGPAPGVGKTFVAINLAAVLADAGKKILLIDGDMRKGFISKVLGTGRENGLSELVSATVVGKPPLLERSIHKIMSANFDFIATGAIPPNPSELLLHERFGYLLESVSKNYDHVIIDSPPILAVTDATIIGRLASATLMVVRDGQHPMHELEECVKRLTFAGVQLKGVVFNDLRASASRYAYGYSKYGYQYNNQPG